MTTPLQQAIERSRTLESEIQNDQLGNMGEFLMQRSIQHGKFREAAAIMAEALVDISHWDETLNDEGFEQDKHHALRMWRGCVATAEQALAKANALFEEPNHD